MTPDTTDFNSLSKKQLVELVIAKYNDCFRLEEENKKLSKRIDTMQEFIDYSEWVVNNAIQMLYEEWWQEKALDYLENCYAVWDDRQYEEMEKLDDYDLEI